MHAELFSVATDMLTTRQSYLTEPLHLIHAPSSPPPQPERVPHSSANGPDPANPERATSPSEGADS